MGQISPLSYKKPIATIGTVGQKKRDVLKYENKHQENIKILRNSSKNNYKTKYKYTSTKKNKTRPT